MLLKENVHVMVFLLLAVFTCQVVSITFSGDLTDTIVHVVVSTTGGNRKWILVIEEEMKFDSQLVSEQMLMLSYMRPAHCSVRTHN